MGVDVAECEAIATVPVAISARHVHLTQSSIEKLFGPRYQLRPRTALVQPGQFAAEETVALVGPHGKLEHVRVLGPPRDSDQVEISWSDALALGLEAPIRLSGDLDGTPGIALEGPAGRVILSCGVVCALRHIHMSPADASRLGVRDRDVVEVAVGGKGRSLVFGDVIVRVSPHYHLELHLDTDEGNAAGVRTGDTGRLLQTPCRK
jgi:acetate kinase